MILPGVPRPERVEFVKTLLGTLVEHGLQELTPEELQDVRETFETLLSSVKISEKPGEGRSGNGC